MESITYPSQESKSFLEGGKQFFQNAAMEGWQVRKQARIRSGLKQHEVGALFDPPITRVAVGFWEKPPEQGGTAPDQKKLMLLSKLYGLTSGQILGYETVDFVHTQIKVAETKPHLDDDKYYYIPVYKQAGGMGNGRSFQHEEISGKHSYSQSFLMQLGLDAAELSRIKGSGDSMESTISDGDTLLINHAEKNIVNGRVYVFNVGDEIRIKRLFRQMDGRVRVVSDNSDKALYPDEFLSVEDMPAIIGRVRDRSTIKNL